MIPSQGPWAEFSRNFLVWKQHRRVLGSLLPFPLKKLALLHNWKTWVRRESSREFSICWHPQSCIQYLMHPKTSSSTTRRRVERFLLVPRHSRQCHVVKYMRSVLKNLIWDEFCFKNKTCNNTDLSNPALARINASYSPASNLLNLVFKFPLTSWLNFIKLTEKIRLLCNSVQDIFFSIVLFFGEKMYQ